MIRFVVDHPKYHHIVKSNYFWKACYGARWSHYDVEPKFEYIEFIIKNAKLLGIDLNEECDYENRYEQSGFCYLLAKTNPNLQIIEFILENAEKYGIDVNIYSKPKYHLNTTAKNGVTPFFITCRNCSFNQNEVIELFIKYKHKVNLNATNEKGQNGLQLALEKYHISTKVIKTLSGYFGVEMPCPDKEMEILKSKLNFSDIFDHLCDAKPGQFYFQGDLYNRSN